MNLKSFLDFNHTCPVCAEPLTLYMQCNDNSLWAANKIKNGFVFNPYKVVNEPFNSADSITLYTNSAEPRFEFNGQFVSRDFKTWFLNFFYMCNRAGLNVKGTSGFDFNPYYACYFRSSPWLEFVKEGNSWNLKTVNPDDDVRVNNDETFCFKQVDQDKEKVYVLNLDYETDKTRLWHYVATTTQRDDEFYEPSLFEKEMPLVNTRPKFENKDKFIDRMDSWILMS